MNNVFLFFCKWKEKGERKALLVGREQLSGKWSSKWETPWKVRPWSWIEGHIYWFLSTKPYQEQRKGVFFDLLDKYTLIFIFIFLGMEFMWVLFLHEIQDYNNKKRKVFFFCVCVWNPMCFVPFVVCLKMRLSRPRPSLFFFFSSSLHGHWRYMWVLFFLKKKKRNHILMSSYILKYFNSGCL